MAKAINKLSDVALPKAGKEKYFKIRVSSVFQYYKSTKVIGEHVWLNKETWNVSPRKPAKKDLENFQAYKVYLLLNPSEKALNEAKWVK